MFRGKEFKTLMGKYREHGQKEEQGSEMNFMFFQLKRLVEKKMFWQVENFEHYIQEDINPFGLRIQIFHTLENINIVFKKQWENNLQQCTKIMMKLLIEEYQKRIVNLEKDIENVYTKLDSFKDLPTYNEHEEGIKTHIDQMVKELIATKERKFWRDKTAFREGIAYRWQQRNTQTRQQRKNNLKNWNKGKGSNSSLNSISSAFSQTSQE